MQTETANRSSRRVVADEMETDAVEIEDDEDGYLPSQLSAIENGDSVSNVVNAFRRLIREWNFPEGPSERTAAYRLGEALASFLRDGEIQVSLVVGAFCTAITGGCIFWVYESYAAHVAILAQQQSFISGWVSDSFNSQQGFQSNGDLVACNTQDVGFGSNPPLITSADFATRELHGDIVHGFYGFAACSSPEGVSLAGHPGVEVKTAEVEGVTIVCGYFPVQTLGN